MSSMRRFLSISARLAPQVQTLKPSATLAINERSNALLQAGQNVYKLGLGQSPFPVPPCMVESLRAHAHEKDYLPVAGLPALQEAYSAFLNRQGTGSFDPSQILVGPGSKELLFIAQLAHDCEILLPNPSWVSYEPQAQLAHRQVHWLTTTAAERWVLQPDVLAAHCAQNPHQRRMLILNFPSNPTGCTHRVHELRALANVARKYNVVIVADEIYGGVTHDNAHVSMAALYPEGTIVSDGLSKAYGAGGWRVGLWAFPKELSWLQEAMQVIASETYTSVSAPIQYAACRAYQENCEDIKTYLQDSRRVCRVVGQYVAQQLKAAGVEVEGPDGGFYLFPNFGPHATALHARNICTSTEFCETLLQETGVAMLPGTAFGREPTELSLRLAYVDFNGAQALEQMAQLPESITPDQATAFVKSNCPRMVEAMDGITAWIDALPRQMQQTA